MISIKATAVLLEGPVALERDSLGYWNLSTLVVQGDILMMSELIAYRTPLYPWYLAVCRVLAERHALWVIGLTQVALYVISIWLAANIAYQITRLPNAKPLTAICMLPALSAIQYTSAVLSETLFVALLLWHLSFVLKYSHHPNRKYAIWSGITFGLTILTRPIALLLFTVHIVLLLFFYTRRKRLKKANEYSMYRVSHFILAGLVVSALLTPWITRNYLLFNKLSLTEFAGRNLWIVTFQDGSGAGLSIPKTKNGIELHNRLSHSGNKINTRSTWSVSNQLVSSGLNDAQADQLMKQVCLDAIDSNQRSFAQKMIRRTINFWRCAHTNLLQQGGLPSQYAPQKAWKQSSKWISDSLQYRFSQSVIGNTVLTAAISLMLFFLIFNPATRPHAIWITLILAYFSIITGTFEIPDYRYRLVMEPLLGSVFGSGISVLLSKRELNVSLAE